jgi:hypothetical protein
MLNTVGVKLMSISWVDSHNILQTQSNPFFAFLSPASWAAVSLGACQFDSERSAADFERFPAECLP